MANCRPVASLYSGSTTVRVTRKNMSRSAHSVTVGNALTSAVRKLYDGRYARCDIYNQHGLHVYALIYNMGSISIRFQTGTVFLEQS